jgi:hypothetical protein
MTMKTTLEYSSFQNPAAAFRSVPFWSLNDWLDPREIVRQLTAFKEGGFGGAYLHSRIGLLTAYLGEDWWLAMDAGVEACRELGLEAWFYDEDKWPSGFAGGIVPRQSESFHARTLLSLEKTGPLPAGSELLSEDQHYRYVSYKVKFGSPWFNGTCWVDLFNPAMVKAFLDCSYTPYAERYRDSIGPVAKGIFTDEPQVSPQPDDVPNHGAIGYSPVVREAFLKQYGYDIADKAACLFEDTGDFRRVRLDYYRCAAGVFERSFSRQLGEYCAETGLAFTGHYNGEENLLSVLRNVGNMMVQYRHMQQPGMDHLGLRIRGGLNAAKSLSSVANQYGQPRRLSELFGISGQNMNFEDRRWIADWHAVLGVNHFVPHLSLYSMKGARKRDYPPTLSPQQPYWAYNKLIEDAMARVCYLTVCGSYAPEFLVIHPLESAYLEYSGSMEGAGPLLARDGQYYRVLETLQSAHRDYDLGDEQILSEIGVVKDGQLEVGRMTYPAVILPYQLTLRRTTLALLEELSAAGGKILAVGEYPSFIDGQVDEAALQRLKRIALLVTDLTDLPRVLAGALPPAANVTGTGSEHVWTHRRMESDGFILQLTNISRLESADIQLSIPAGRAPWAVWDPADGNCYSLAAQAGEAFALHLEAAQTLLVTSGIPSLAAQVTGPYRLPARRHNCQALIGPWQGRRLDPNALTLDFARYSTDGGATFSTPEPVIGIHARLTRQQYRGPLQLEFTTEIGDVPAACWLVVEQPELYAFQINNKVLEFSDLGFYRDATFRKAEITPFLQPGTNTILLSTVYTAPIPDSFDAVERYGTEIESIYLVGDFAVEGVVSAEPPPEGEKNHSGDFVVRPIRRFSSFRLAAEGRTFDGDLALQGYPFYAGAFELACDFDLPVGCPSDCAWLKFPDVEAVVVQAELNGVALAPTAWSPWEIDLSGALRDGKNHLKLVLVNSLRNLLGPHHHFGGELAGVGPDSFTGRTTWTGPGTGESNWYDVRLSAPTGIWRDDYHCIPFGLLQPPVILAGPSV